VKKVKFILPHFPLARQGVGCKTCTLFFCAICNYDMLKCNLTMDNAHKQTTTTEINTDNCVVRVAVPLAIPKVLDYTWQGKTQPETGMFVEAPVGNQKTHGIVVDLPKESAFKKLKSATFIDVPKLTKQTVSFWQWVCRYNLCLPGDALRASLIKAQVPELPTEEVIYLYKTPKKKPTNQQQKVIDALQYQSFSTQTQIAELVGVSTSVVNGLMKQGVLTKKEKLPQPPKPTFNLLPLSEPQQKAANAVIQSEKDVFLLDGTMGSGKTEVYFEIIADKIKTGKQSLVLVPEIALTPQWIDRFKKRFGFKPIIWHSSISEKARQKAWWDVLTDRAPVIIGARSALFMPFHNLGLIVVDEEHDNSYKQEDVFRYNGRDMAIVAASIWQCPIVLASGTPSLETWHNAKTGKYIHLEIPGRHVKNPPQLKMVDIKHSGLEKDCYLTSDFIRRIESRLARGEQSLLFLNRRGVAPLMLCGDCGHRIDCPSCDASLVVHGERLICHHCGFKEHIPENCPKCHKDALRTFGPGTRKIMEEVNKHFPLARVEVADSDAIHTHNQMGALLEKMEGKEVDILIGTQMITKGHHFPDLTFVGIIDADMGLAHGDMCAAEKTFQLLMQVSGRAGRAEKEGEVLLQSYQPNHPLYNALINRERDAFLELELQNRKEWGDPPFGRMIGLILSGKNEQHVIQAGRTLVQNKPQEEGLQVLGPAPAPMTKLRDNYRYRILVKSPKSAQKQVQNWLANTPISSKVRVIVDVDPVSFY
jgi:primosomal protein N' (replication factor Y)